MDYKYKVITIRIFGVLLFSQLAMIALAQKPVEIKGTLSSSDSKQLKLYSVLEGTLEEITAFNVKDDGAFRFLFYPEYEGFYVFGTGTSTAPSHNNIFYFKDGDQLNIDLTDTTYVLQGRSNSKENQILSAWFEQSFKVKQKSIEWKRHYLGSTFVDFFPDLEKLYKDSPAFIARYKSNNPKFDKTFPIIVKWDIASFGLSYLFTGRRVHPTAEQHIDAINYVNPVNFTKNTKEAFLYPYGQRTVNLLTLKESIKGKAPKLDYLFNDTLKGYLVLDDLQRIKDRGIFTEKLKQSEHYIATANQKKILALYETNLSPFNPGDPGFEFSFPDSQGKMHSFRDFRGKVVVIDVWATWCGPCLQEAPYFKSLAETFSDKEVVFIGISTDQEKDKVKWLDMLHEKAMNGIQLHGGSGNPFSKYYLINTIPRFLVFDKQGRLVSSDAPKPSDPSLKLIIERELKK